MMRPVILSRPANTAVGLAILCGGGSITTSSLGCGAASSGCAARLALAGRQAGQRPPGGVGGAAAARWPRRAAAAAAAVCTSRPGGGPGGSAAAGRQTVAAAYGCARRPVRHVGRRPRRRIAEDGCRRYWETAPRRRRGEQRPQASAARGSRIGPSAGFRSRLKRVSPAPRHARPVNTGNAAGKGRLPDRPASRDAA